MEKRRRRINVESKVRVSDSTARLNEIGVAYAKAIREREKLQAVEKELAIEAEALMKFLKISELEVPGYGTHNFKGGNGRGSNDIDPKKFKELVGDNVFWAVANIPSGKAKEHLGTKELEGITTHTPGKSTPASYSFKK